MRGNGRPRTTPIGVFEGHPTVVASGESVLGPGAATVEPCISHGDMGFKEDLK